MCVATSSEVANSILEGSLLWQEVLDGGSFILRNKQLKSLKKSPWNQIDTLDPYFSKLI